MKKIYEAPELDIEKFQFQEILGVSNDDPNTSHYAPDPFGDDD